MDDGSRPPCCCALLPQTAKTTFISPHSSLSPVVVGGWAVGLAKMALRQSLAYLATGTLLNVVSQLVVSSYDFADKSAQIMPW